MLRCCFATSLFLLFALIATLNSPAKEWTAKSGHTITGDYLSLKDGTVRISLPGGAIAAVPLDQLSEEDQKYVESLINPSPFVLDKLGFNTPRDVLEQEAQKDNPEALYYLARCYAQGWNDCPKDEKKAGELYQKGSQSADTGNPFAQCCRAGCYMKGAGVPEDEAEAVKWFRKAAEQGNAAGQSGLGTCYAKGMGVPQDEAEAVKWCRLAAEQGEAESQCFLGICYTKGMGVREDEVEAFKWYLKSAERGFAPGQFMLALCYAGGEGVRQDEAEAIKWLRKAAEQGVAPAQNNLGACYERGEGVRRDEAEAAKWYRLAAEQGEGDAQNNLGVCYLNGDGVPTDEAEAVKWFRKAAEQGFLIAQVNLGERYAKGEGVPKDEEEAARWFLKCVGLLSAVKQEFAYAKNFLGVCYLNGTGVSKDETEAVYWFLKAAEQGFARAQFNLGVCYSHGTGVPKDEAEAVKCYLKAAEQGETDAQNNLALCYAKGTGVPKDEVEAVKWYLKAAEQGNVMAQTNLGECYAKGEGVQKNEAEAVKWYRLATEQGFALAQTMLGVCYFNGTGVPKDEVEAVKWFCLAAEQGEAQAQRILGICYFNGIGVPKDEAEGVKWFRRAAEQGDEQAVNVMRELEGKGGGTPQPTPTEKEDRKAGERIMLKIKDVEYAFRWCPAGTFTMGSPESEQDRSDDETQHQVTLSRGFWMLETQVTQAMWESVMGSNPSYFKGKKLPVETVSWDDSQEYIKKLNAHLAGTPGAPAGFKFSLPTEAQWEYACRAGTTTAYHFGDALDKDKANYGGNIDKTTDVGSYPANAWGLYDMHGNVLERCLDWHDDYPSGAVTDPVGASTGSYRVFRSGCWGSRATRSRSASRDYGKPSSRSYNVGLRLSLVSESKVEAAPQPTPAPQPPSGTTSSGVPQGNSGIVGVWLAPHYLLSGMSWSHIIFYEDGTYRFMIPLQGLYGFDKEKDKKDNEGENVWGTYTFDGSTGKWKYYASNPNAWSEIKLEPDGGLYLGSSYGRFYRCTSVDNYKLDGSYTTYSDTTHPDLSKPGEKCVIRFKSDGTFIDDGLFAAIFAWMGTEAKKQYASGGGTYELKDFSLILRYSDGRTIQTKFTFSYGPKSKDASGYVLFDNNMLLHKMPDGKGAQPMPTPTPPVIIP